MGWSRGRREEGRRILRYAYCAVNYDEVIRNTGRGDHLVDGQLMIRLENERGYSDS